MLIWSQIDDNDIAIFKSVKKVRDRISHGENVDGTSLPVDKIKRLAFKLLGV